MKKVIKIISLYILMFAISSCTVNPIGAFKLSKTNLQDRQVQSREYKNIEEENILSASAAVLQDMGYTISESETRLGVITAKKDADATNGAQVALVVLAALFGGGNAGAIDDRQQFTIMVVVLPRGNSGTHFVRMTMQRIVWNTQGGVTKLETVKSEQVYKDFFDKLSKAVFLEKNI